MDAPKEDEATPATNKDVEIGTDAKDNVDEVPMADATEVKIMEADTQPTASGRVKDLDSGVSFTLQENPLNATSTELYGDPSGDMAGLLKPRAVPSGVLLATDQLALSHSMIAIRFAVLATACGQTILLPNFPFLVIPGHPDAFPDTEPFGFSSALYFLPLTTLMGAAITSAFVGQLSDRIGRRPCILVSLGFMSLTMVVQFFARHTFWGFCGASFLNGLFCSSLPVAIAYASDVHPNRAKKDEEIGILVGFNMMGMSGGGVVAILMEDVNLFLPCLVDAGASHLAFLWCAHSLIEPDKTIHFQEDSDEEGDDAPTTIDWKVFSNVIAGALLDNFGSSGLFPLTLAPLAFDTYLQDFVIAGESPIMTPTAYKWLSVCGMYPLVS